MAYSKLFAIAVAASATAALASPVDNQLANRNQPAPSKCTPSPKTATFNVTFDTPQVVPAAPEANIIPTPFYELEYQSFVFDQLGVAGVYDSLTPASGNQVAATGLVNQAITGTPLITTQYSGSNVSTFSLHSFYYACGLNSLEGAAGTVTECVLQLTGLDASNKTIAGPKNFAYTYASPLKALMTLANVDGQFNDITTLLIDVLQSDSGIETTATLLDNFYYTTKSTQLYGCSGPH